MWVEILALLECKQITYVSWIWLPQAQRGDDQTMSGVVGELIDSVYTVAHSVPWISGCFSCYCEASVWWDCFFTFPSSEATLHPKCDLQASMPAPFLGTCKKFRILGLLPDLTRASISTQIPRDLSASESVRSSTHRLWLVQRHSYWNFFSWGF